MKRTTTSSRTGFPEKLPAAGQPLDYRLSTALARRADAAPARRRGSCKRASVAASPSWRQDEQQFIVDFTGPSLAALPANATVKAVVTAPSNGQIVESNAYRVEATGAWRMAVRVKQLRPNGNRPSCAAFFKAARMCSPRRGAIFCRGDENSEPASLRSQLASGNRSRSDNWLANASNRRSEPCCRRRRPVAEGQLPLGQLRAIAKPVLACRPCCIVDRGNFHRGF